MYYAYEIRRDLANQSRFECLEVDPEPSGTVIVKATKEEMVTFLSKGTEIREDLKTLAAEHLEHHLRVDLDDCWFCYDCDIVTYSRHRANSYEDLGHDVGYRYLPDEVR